MSEDMFGTYCRYVLGQSNAPYGRYSKEDLRRYVMNLPYAAVTMVGKDLQVQQLPIIPDDLGVREWIEQKVVALAMEGGEWWPQPFLRNVTKLPQLREWNEWRDLDAVYMPDGLEPAMLSLGADYEFEGRTLAISEIRFLPGKSFEYRRA